MRTFLWVTGFVLFLAAIWFIAHHASGQTVKTDPIPGVVTPTTRHPGVASDPIPGVPPTPTPSGHAQAQPPPPACVPTATHPCPPPKPK